MSTIPKGTHGVLTNSNSGVTIPATFHNADSSYINAIIDGTSPGNTNTSYARDGWTFAPDFALPAVAGSVVNVSSSGSRGATWMLLRNGAWFSADGFSKAPDDFRDFIKRNQFAVRELS